MSLFASNGGPIVNELVSTEDVTVTSISDEALFSAFTFNSDSERFEINTLEEIESIQIFSTDGELEFQLPVSAQQVKLNVNLFSTGDSKLGFVVKGKTEVQYTQVTIK